MVCNLFALRLHSFLFETFALLRISRLHSLWLPAICACLCSPLRCETYARSGLHNYASFYPNNSLAQRFWPHNTLNTTPRLYTSSSPRTPSNLGLCVYLLALTSGWAVPHTLGVAFPLGLLSATAKAYASIPLRSETYTSSGFIAPLLDGIGSHDCSTFRKSTFASLRLHYSFAFISSPCFDGIDTKHLLLQYGFAYCLRTPRQYALPLLSP